MKKIICLLFILVLFSPGLFSEENPAADKNSAADSRAAEAEYAAGAFSERPVISSTLLSAGFQPGMVLESFLYRENLTTRIFFSGPSRLLKPELEQIIFPLP